MGAGTRAMRRVLSGVAVAAGVALFTLEVVGIAARVSLLGTWRYDADELPLDSYVRFDPARAYFVELGPRGPTWSHATPYVTMGPFLWLVAPGGEVVPPMPFVVSRRRLLLVYGWGNGEWLSRLETIPSTGSLDLVRVEPEPYGWVLDFVRCGSGAEALAARMRMDRVLYRPAQAEFTVVEAEANPVSRRWGFTVAVVQQDPSGEQRQYLVWVVKREPQGDLHVADVVRLK